MQVLVDSSNDSFNWIVNTVHVQQTSSMFGKFNGKYLCLHETVKYKGGSHPLGDCLYCDAEKAIYGGWGWGGVGGVLAPIRDCAYQDLSSGIERIAGKRWDRAGIGTGWESKLEPLRTSQTQGPLTKLR